MVLGGFYFMGMYVEVIEVYLVVLEGFLSEIIGMFW